MGKGRPPKPIDKHIQDGTYRRHRHATRVVEMAAAGHPTMPTWLTGEARNWWRRNVPKLVRLGVCRENDSDMLASAANWWARWRQLNDAITADPDPKTVAACASASRQYQNIVAKFGMSPLDRCKIKTDKPSEEVDPLLEMLRKRQSTN